MNKRIDIAKVQPKALSAMLTIENYLAETELSNQLKEIIKIRSSMINKCAYCIQMHTTAALELGIDQQKLFAISAWSESPLFDNTERALLKLTDEMTLISNNAVTDETYAECFSLLGEVKLAEAMMQIIMINSWNRFALATKMKH
ncbi:carboxymuconolactone decarboxylase family protein [Photobacterium sp. NCIMB 13483]|uniref:Carboxymuconolactone decarboxylase family protein n=1 Tax=Photobacterium piscicola TaxID=1378299 RepID=A0A1T5HZ65_9GAMM|nr:MULTISPECIES: carboxymuconolactone decarboxylase family protein [Photobacterium]MEC6821998.1 carboxymuconolactone decarboxylase family protein [Photobacterium piscicola]MEC6880888.1 carboxymuconolactone decarboxylase family protein [Photobacterium piscicola]MEC6897606.1 carboxymuconolactone decarboxylase family protein [Photobacterium piscicola]PST94789.1 carboxymuconolactone decarboxylase family protein [Photobacterium sp. NCIMB 13483]SKC32110.1 Carboxymuconolactone decarboxylase family pr